MLRKILITAVLSIFFLNQLALAAEFRFSPRPNKANLIKWREWGKGAFDEAKRDDKLVLLSLSAVWCHWCHVMDETTYSDMDIIDYINKNMVPVRVDANMRPDVDSLYNQGGWPSTVILTPEGEIVQGGTYIAQDSMLAWLSRYVGMFKNDKEAVRERIEAIRKRREAGRITEPSAPGSPVIARITGIIGSAYDNKYGGFGGSQKFPNPDAIDFLLSLYEKSEDPRAKNMIATTLGNMLRGEIHDKVEGGFFRYSTMPDWSSPHYEKMLDLNAALVGNYASAYMVFGDIKYKKAVTGTLAYIEKYLYNRDSGAFFGSQDADEEYYRKTKRAGINPPNVDRTIYADSNARIISALVAAYSATGKREYLDKAGKAADFILERLYSEKDGVYHYDSGGGRLSGLLSDNVLFGLALVDLYNATGEGRYLDSAEHIARLLTGSYCNSKKKQFIPALGTAGVDPSTASALRDYNSALSNYRAAIFLNRLYYVNGRKDLREIADAVNTRSGAGFEEYEPAAALYGTALLWSQEDPLVITVVADGGKAGRFLRQLNKMFIPRKAVRIYSLKTDADKIRELGYPPEEAAYICKGKRCSPAVTAPGGLIAAIKKFMKDSGRADR